MGNSDAVSRVQSSTNEDAMPFADGNEGNVMTDNTLLTVPEVAKRLRLSPNKVYELLHAGQIPHIRPGRKFLIPTQSLERWIETAAQIEDTNTDVIPLSRRLVG